jgi:hypothetical protein
MDPLGTEWPIVPAPGDYDDGEFGGMKLGRGNRSTRRQPAPAPLCPPQIPLDQTRACNQNLLVRGAFVLKHPVTNTAFLCTLSAKTEADETRVEVYFTT